MSYIDHAFIILINQLISTVTGCVSISAFVSLVGVPIGITSSAIGLKALIDSNVSHDEFAFVNNVLKGLYNMKEEILIINKSSDYIYYCIMLSYIICI